MRIIGLTGKKQTGKDAFAKILQSYEPGWQRVSFAGELKAMAKQIFGLTDEEVDGAKKDQPFADGRTVRLDDYLSHLKNYTALDLKPAGKEAATPRQLLQFLGTDYVREVDPDFWAKVVRAKIEEAPSAQFVITDVRFENEAAMVRELGGVVVRIRRLEGHGEEPVFLFRLEEGGNVEEAHNIAEQFMAKQPHGTAIVVPPGLTIDMKEVLKKRDEMRAEHEGAHASETQAFAADFELAMVDGHMAPAHAIADAIKHGRDIPAAFQAWDWNMIRDLAGSGFVDSPIPVRQMGLYYGRHLFAELRSPKA